MPSQNKTLANASVFCYSNFMLTDTEENYLNKLPEEVANKPVKVYPWDKKGLEVAQSIINDIKSTLPDLEVVFIGSMALQIAGQKDIDLSILCPTKDFPENQKKLEKLFGSPDRIGHTSIPWHFIKDGYEVGVYLTDPKTSQIQEQINVFNLLKNDKNFLKMYEDLKLAADGLPYREYQIKKYDFYHKILGKL